MYLGPNAPHDPAYFAPRHASMFSSTPLPKPSSFNEADLSDKPQWVRNKPRLSSNEVSNLTEFYRKRLRALQPLDEMVGRLVDALRARGKLSNTYIVLTSDNGIYLGEHRLQAKGAAYNASPRVPLLVRGPGVPRGVTRSQMVLNNDPAPTFASWADVRPPSFVGARAVPEVEPAGHMEDRLPRRAQAYAGGVRLRASHTQLLRAEDGPLQLRRVRNRREELYDLNADPTELTSIHANAAPSLLSSLRARLDALKACAGAGCRTAENGG